MELCWVFTIPTHHSMMTHSHQRRFSASVVQFLVFFVLYIVINITIFLQFIYRHFSFSSQNIFGRSKSELEFAVFCWELCSACCVFQDLTQPNQVKATHEASDINYTLLEHHTLCRLLCRLTICCWANSCLYHSLEQYTRVYHDRLWYNLLISWLSARTNMGLRTAR